MKNAIGVAFTSLLLVSTALSQNSLSKFRFDGTSEETTKKSNTIIMSQLPDRKKAEYLAALVRIQDFDRKQRRKKDPKAKVTPLGPKVHGKTYAEIMAYSKQFPDVVTVIEQ